MNEKTSLIKIQYKLRKQQTQTWVQTNQQENAKLPSKPLTNPSRNLHQAAKGTYHIEQEQARNQQIKPDPQLNLQKQNHT